MNPLLQQLKQQAGIDFNPDQEGLDLFAQLIVAECGDVAYKSYWDNPDVVRGIHIKEQIQQHFGVKL